MKFVLVLKQIQYLGIIIFKDLQSFLPVEHVKNLEVTPNQKKLKNLKVNNPSQFHQRIEVREQISPLKLRR